MRTSNDLAARFQNEPAMVAPERSAAFQACLIRASEMHGRLVERAETDAPAMSDDFWPASDSWMARVRPYVVKDGILQIPVKGVLLNDFPYALGDWATGYDYIWRAFERGMGDLNVKGIALVVDSPGGMVAGNFSLVDKMFAMRGVKPVRGYASEHAYSAAYSIISVCDPGQIHVTRTGGVGSIGVVTSHTDWSKWNADFGINITFIFAGKHKVDGNPEQPLPDDVKARIQARIDELYSVFVSTVARNRKLDDQAVRDTEAMTFTASEALSNGLADKIGDLDDALAEFAADLTPHEEEDQMSDKDNNPMVVDQATHDAALAQARGEGATAERGRIVAILGCDAAKDRPVAAMAAALETDMSVEQASAFLGKLPAEAAAVVAAPEPAASAGVSGAIFDAAMGNTDNPNVGSPAAGNLAPEDDAIEQSFAGRSRKKAA